MGRPGRCKRCGTASSFESPQTPCPKCGTPAGNVVFSTPAPRAARPAGSQVAGWDGTKDFWKSMAVGYTWILMIGGTAFGILILVAIVWMAVNALH